MLQTIHSISSCANFGDKRLNLRFEKILNTFSVEVEDSIPQTFKQWGQIKSVYRFLSNNKVSQEAIIDAQLKSYSSLDHSGDDVVLAIHDTTELDLTGNRSQEQLGCLSYEKQRGLYLHNTLLCSVSGVPQSIFHQHYWKRDAASLGKKQQRANLPIEEKESGRWIEGIQRVQEHFKKFPSIKVIQICDREGDIYELLTMAHQDNSHYIIRSRTDRRIQDKEEKLWEQLKTQPSQGSYTIEITDRQLLQKRIATLAVRWLENIILLPPKNYKGGTPTTVNMVYVEEVNPPQGATPISWKLITSLPVSSFDQARTIITYYTYRWRIESFHYILKQGCKVEDLQLEQEHNLKNAISIYSLIACRLLAMMHSSREQPNASICTIGFTKQQYAILYTYLEKNYQFKIDEQMKRNYTTENSTLLIGMLGGYQKHNKGPGIKTLWRGMKEFLLILNSFDLLNEIRCG